MYKRNVHFLHIYRNVSENLHDERTLLYSAVRLKGVYRITDTIICHRVSLSFMFIPVLVWGQLCYQLLEEERSSMPTSLEGSSKGQSDHTHCKWYKQGLLISTVFSASSEKYQFSISVGIHYFNASSRSLLLHQENSSYLWIDVVKQNYMIILQNFETKSEIHSFAVNDFKFKY